MRLEPADWLIRRDFDAGAASPLLWLKPSFGAREAQLGGDGARSEHRDQVCAVVGTCMKIAVEFRSIDMNRFGGSR